MLVKDPDVILPDTLKLLEILQNDQELSEFFLVGGTALALQIGHRLSIDLDFFSIQPFDTQTLSDHLFHAYQFQTTAVAKNTLMGVIAGVKVDILMHPYPLVKDLEQTEGIRLASIEDIGAMKLNAIAHSGQRLKDFLDVYFLLELMPLKTLLEAYQIKYPNSNMLIPLKGLIYFDDIDFEMDPPVLNREIKFSTLKDRLLRAVEFPERVFS